MDAKLKAVKIDAHWYGLEDITGGNPDAHWRYKTRDGVRHRSQKQAVKHMQTQAVDRLARAWGARRS